MDIKTKYNLGQEVVSIREDHLRVWDRCTFCDGSDGPKSMLDRTKIVGRNKETRLCPVCRGNGGKWKISGKTWVVGVRLTIGQVSVMINRSTMIGENKREERYMCRETGIGSGRVWAVDKLFLTEEDALAECDIRNNHEKQTQA